nr:MAG TPA: hypothetical protein [Caudoviricetes sp.]
MRYYSLGRFTNNLHCLLSIQRKSGVNMISPMK